MSERYRHYRPIDPWGIHRDTCQHPVDEVLAVQKAIQISLGNPETRKRVIAQLGRDVEEIDADNERDRTRWAEIASLWQPVGGDA